MSNTRVPNLRPHGIPDAVCSAIEKTMAFDPAGRPASVAEFGRELQAVQRRNGLKPDSMAITAAGAGSGRPVGRTSPSGPISRPNALPRIADVDSATNLINSPNNRNNHGILK